MRTGEPYCEPGLFPDEAEYLRGDAHGDIRGSLRHSREYTRAQRERYIAKRRRLFARWLSGCDWGVGMYERKDGRFRLNAPRPLEQWEAEFWSPWRVGKFAKWNGNCTHCSRLRRADANKKHPQEKYGWRKDAA